MVNSPRTTSKTLLSNSQISTQPTSTKPRHFCFSMETESIKYQTFKRLKLFNLCASQDHWKWITYLSGVMYRNNIKQLLCIEIFSNNLYASRWHDDAKWNWIYPHWTSITKRTKQQNVKIKVKANKMVTRTCSFSRFKFYKYSQIFTVLFSYSMNNGSEQWNLKKSIGLDFY